MGHDNDRPEIDPELAEMEAAMQEARGRRNGKSGGHDVDTLMPGGHDVLKTERKPKGVTKHRKAMGRLMRRRYARAQAPAVLATPNLCRLPSRAKPVKSQAQLLIEFKRATREELKRMTLVKCIRGCPDIRYIAGVPKLRTALQLVNANQEFINGIPGFGPKRRAKVHAYLTTMTRGVVQIHWEP